MGMISSILSFVRTKIGDSNVTDVKVDPGGSPNKTVQHFSAPGDDSFPVDTDYCYLSDLPARGRAVALGYVDSLNEPVAQKGDKRSYARNEEGVTVSQIWQKNNGDVLVSNDNGSILLRADGGSIVTTPGSTFECDSQGNITADNGSGKLALNSNGSIKGENAGSFELQQSGIFEVNKVTIDLAGNIVTPTTITAAAVNAGTMSASSSLTVAGKEMNNHVHTGSPSAPTGPVTNTGGPV